MRRLIISLIVLLGASSPLIRAADLQLQDNPPDRYTVVKGDTLWGISGRFLKEPWRWPEIWKLNKEQIKNPHWIYPGDVIILDMSGGSPHLRLLNRLETVKLSPTARAEPSPAGAIPSVSPTAIGPFLSKPLVIEENGLDKAPYILSTQEERVVIGAGNTAYVHGLKTSSGSGWHIYRPGKALVDPDTQVTLGIEAVYLGDARVTRFGEVSTVEIVKSNQEIHRGDRLVPIVEETVNAFAPHAPDRAVNGRILSVYGAVSEVGQFAIVALSLGKNSGLEPGHVLAMHRHGAMMTAIGQDDKVLQLPNERYGLVFVFRVFDKVSYGLTMQSTRPIHVLDDVRTP